MRDDDEIVDLEDGVSLVEPVAKIKTRNSYWWSIRLGELYGPDRIISMTSSLPCIQIMLQGKLVGCLDFNTRSAIRPWRPHV